MLLYKGKRSYPKQKISVLTVRPKRTFDILFSHTDERTSFSTSCTLLMNSGHHFDELWHLCEIFITASQFHLNLQCIFCTSFLFSPNQLSVWAINLVITSAQHHEWKKNAPKPCIRTWTTELMHKSKSKSANQCS